MTIKMLLARIKISFINKVRNLKKILNRNIRLFFRVLLHLFFKEEYMEIFFFNESKELLGRKYLKNLWMLIFMFFMTFLAIGIATGSLDYLKKEMASPFINWVPVDAPTTANIMQIKTELEKDTAAQKKYHYKSVIGYYQFSLRFRDEKSGGTYVFDGRTIEPGDPLLEEIIKSHKLYGKTFCDSNDLGIIVKESMLRDLHMSLNSPYLFMAFSDDSILMADRAVQLAIVAVVDDLPDHSDFCTTSQFYMQRRIGTNNGNLFDPVRLMEVDIMTLQDSLSTEKSLSDIRTSFANQKKIQSHVTWYQIYKDTSSYISTYRISLSIDGLLPQPQVNDSIYNALIQIPGIGKNFHRFYNYNTLAETRAGIENPPYDRLSVEFSSIEKLDKFRKEYLNPTHHVLLDMTQTENLMNYVFVSGLTTILSGILIGFGLLCITLFVSNLLNSHLQKIKMNIGTFSSFGIDPYQLQNIYLFIIMNVITGAMISGFLLAYVSGMINIPRGILTLFSIKLKENVTYFQLINPKILILFIVILIINYLILKRLSLKQIFLQTPGNLIYNRD